MQKEECEALMSILINFGTDNLKKYKEFYPYGAVILSDDTVEFTDFFDGDNHPDSQKIIDGLIEVHKGLAKDNKIKVSGIAWDGRVTDENGNITDAIMISLEHKDDFSVIAYLPYKFGFLKTVKFGELQATKGKNDIF